jgi:hypothetical protein
MFAPAADYPPALDCTGGVFQLAQSTILAAIRVDGDHPTPHINRCLGVSCDARQACRADFWIDKALAKRFPFPEA